MSRGRRWTRSSPVSSPARTVFCHTAWSQSRSAASAHLSPASLQYFTVVGHARVKTQPRFRLRLGGSASRCTCMCQLLSDNGSMWLKGLLRINTSAVQEFLCLSFGSVYHCRNVAHFTKVCEDSVEAQFQELHGGGELDAPNRAPDKLLKGRAWRQALRASSAQLGAHACPGSPLHSREAPAPCKWPCMRHRCTTQHTQARAYALLETAAPFHP